MAVKKPVPCSIYDIRGIQEWLDEMARNGLFLAEVNSHLDRAVFETGDPAPVRYRLDPLNKDSEKNEERKELYVQMGWTYVTQIGCSFNLYSCDDPSAPELYSDPQSLALALDNWVRRGIRNSLLVGLFAIAVLLLTFFLPPGRALQNLLLWEDLADLVEDCFYIVFIIVYIPLLVLDIRRMLKIRSTLAQGLPLKAKKRWNRPPFLAWYLPLMLVLIFLPDILFPSVGWEVQGLDEAVLSHPWPTAAQLEAVGPAPLTEEPEMDGYVRVNDSPFAPVQEYVSVEYYLPSLGGYWTGVRYVQARSPKIAALIYRLERNKEVRYYEKAPSYPNNNRITELQPFQPWHWPGLDRAELARYHRHGQDVWTLLLLREADVLMVEYSGRAQPEDCLPLFLDALDKEVTP